LIASPHSGARIAGRVSGEAFDPNAWLISESPRELAFALSIAASLMDSSWKRSSERLVTA
jgi:hypothetical protein